jgi:hypothetical protein
MGHSLNLCDKEISEIGQPVINEYELDLVSRVLSVTNPGRSSASHISDMIRSNWPFSNLSTGGWVAYMESPNNNNVRLALTPYTQDLWIKDQNNG